ncbi:sortase domain-bontaining protein, partial [Rhizobium johnstonii]|uniref:sortase domain-containing protein n=1 Tax=Rhizobium johnstonii TaxID=3019933 RepID=UPI003F953F90
KAGKAFGVLYVPRFGDTYQRNIAEGTGTDVLNSTKLGIGHYPDTQLPGEVGNFAIASHRSAYGGGMHVLNEFQLGDPIIVQTA